MGKTAHLTCALAASYSMRYLAFMRNRSLLLVCACAMTFAASCAKRDPLAPQKGGSLLQESLPGVSIPLEVVDYDVLNESGYRGIFLKLSRLPDSVAHNSHNDPARIVLEITGPTGGELPEQSFPGGDTLISRVRVAPHPGVLWVSLDLQGNEAPLYTVHSMADWVMVRIAAPER
jgi:hypothetical protein